MKTIVQNSNSIKETMMWTDEGFKNVVDTRLFDKRVEEIKSLSKFKLGNGRVYRKDKESFNESVYDMNKSSLGTRLYTGAPYREFTKTDHIISVWQKNMLFIYNSQKEADVDKENRESYGREISYKTLLLRPHLYEVEAIKVNGRYDQLTTFYVYENDPVRVWFWVEDMKLYFYAIDNMVDIEFMDMFDYCKCINIRECI